MDHVFCHCGGDESATTISRRDNRVNLDRKIMSTPSTSRVVHEKVFIFLALSKSIGNMLEAADQGCVRANDLLIAKLGLKRSAKRVAYLEKLRDGEAFVMLEQVTDHLAEGCEGNIGHEGGNHE